MSAFRPTPPIRTSRPGLRDVEAAYERKYGTKPRSGHSLANYVGAKLFLDALARAGSLDKDKVRDAVLATDIPLDATANSWGARFDDKGQNTLRAPGHRAMARRRAAHRRIPAAASWPTLRPQLGTR